MKKQHIYTLLFCLSLCLLGLNIVGKFSHLRNEEIYTKPFEGEFGIKLTETEFHTAIEKLYATQNLSDSVKIIKTTQLVNQAMAHYWFEEEKHEYKLTVPLWENYLLNICSYLYSEKFELYEFMNWHKAVERGVGMCSQQAIVVSEILKEHDIPVKLISLGKDDDGHVIAMARVNADKWIISDPDYGVNIPHNITEIENDVTLISPHYAAVGYDNSYTDVLERYYGKKGNRIMEGMFSMKSIKSVFEKLTYIGIWLIPLLLALPFFRYQFKKKAA